MSVSADRDDHNKEMPYDSMQQYDAVSPAALSLLTCAGLLVYRNSVDAKRLESRDAAVRTVRSND